jgi:hypothetical protein
MFMLDTDICRYILRAHPKAVLAKFKSLDPDARAHSDPSRRNRGLHRALDRASANIADGSSPPQ